MAPCSPSSSQSSSAGVATTSSALTTRIFDLERVRTSSCTGPPGEGQTECSARAECLRALQTSGYVLLRLNETDSAALRGELDRLPRAFSELSKSTKTKSKPCWNRLMKCGYATKHGGEFLDLRNTPVGVRPRIGGTGTGFGPDAYRLLKGITEEFLEYVRAEFLELEERDAFSHVLVDEERGTDEGEGGADEDAFVTSSSVLRCSRYGALDGDADGVAGQHSEASISFPAHTDASFLTASLARRGLELLQPPESAAAPAALDHEVAEGRPRPRWTRIQNLLHSSAQDDEHREDAAALLEKMSKSLVLTLWVGDFLELLSGGRFAALPHRIRFYNDDAEGPSDTERQRHRENITFLLRPDDRKLLDTRKVPTMLQFRPCSTSFLPREKGAGEHEQQRHEDEESEISATTSTTPEGVSSSCESDAKAEGAVSEKGSRILIESIRIFLDRKGKGRDFRALHEDYNNNRSAGAAIVLDDSDENSRCNAKQNDEVASSLCCPKAIFISSMPMPRDREGRLSLLFQCLRIGLDVVVHVQVDGRHN